MKIQTICLARNEADILESFIRHHVRFSSVTIVLHRCLDNSKEILASLVQEGLPLTWTEDTRFSYEQHDVMTQMMTQAFANGADWVLPLDADEFLLGDVESVLLEHSTTPHVVRVPWRGYVPHKEDDLAEPHVLRRIMHRREKECMQWYKVLVPRALGADTKLSMGNHFLCTTSDVAIEAVDAPLTLAHFPVRTSRQIARKVFGGWLANCSRSDHTVHSCFQWKYVFDALKKNRELSLSELTDIALTYAVRKDLDVARVVPIIFDPIPCTFDIRYPIADIDPMTVLLIHAEDLAIEYGKLRKILCDNTMS